MNLNKKAVPVGVFTFTVRNVPYFGTVRVIFTEGVKSTGKRDGVFEVNISEVNSNPDFVAISRLVG